MTLQRIREPVARLEGVIPQAADDVFNRKSEFSLVAANVTLKAVGEVMKLFSPRCLVQLNRSLHYGVAHFTSMMASENKECYLHFKRQSAEEMASKLGVAA